MWKLITNTGTVDCSDHFSVAASNFIRLSIGLQTTLFSDSLFSIDKEQEVGSNLTDFCHFFCFMFMLHLLKMSFCYIYWKIN